MPPRKPTQKPDWSNLTVPQLQKEVSKYGFKLSTERSVLLGQLERCWTALHPEPAETAVCAVGPKPRKAAVKKPPKTEEDELELKRRVVELVRADEELYVKLLRYEVSCFLRASFAEMSRPADAAAHSRSISSRS